MRSAAENARRKSRSENARRASSWRSPAGTFADQADVTNTFQSIYDRELWNDGSGGGSVLKASVALYLGYVQHFIERHDIRTIVDVGCGDWTFSRFLDLGDRHYVGLDVVPSVIERNEQRYARENVQFRLISPSKIDAYPASDLIICKDVLQHLSNEHVDLVLMRMENAKYAIITNDHALDNRENQNGDTRPLDVTAPPFHLIATPVLWFDKKLTVLRTRVEDPT